MTCDRTGCTRIVFLIKNWAIKVPNFLDGWPRFLMGLLANYQETLFSKGDWHEGKLCPVIFSIWGGWLLIMPKVEVLTDEEFCQMDRDWRIIKNTKEFPDAIIAGYICCEWKSNSFGKLNGKTVCIDYGN